MQMHWVWVASAALVVAGLGQGAGCSAGKNSAQFGDDDASGGHGASSSGGSGGGILLGGFGGSVGGGSSGCSEEAKLVYVVGTGNELYSFYPPTLALEQVGTINCPSAGSATPFSMAVDRNTMAWVLFNDGHLFKVDITHGAQCTATSFAPNQVTGFDKFGMGFVSDSPGSTEETLYLGSYDGIGIARLDFSTMSVVPIGQYDLLSGAAEITGTGDARLYGFFLNTPVVVAEINKTNSKIISQAPQPTIDIGAGWAFAFWGGDFWLFTCPSMYSSQIDRYRPSDGTTSTVVPSVGFNIVGAGVSTCAPFEPPA